MDAGNLPGALLDSLEGVTGFNRESFIKIHQGGTQVTSVRFNPLKPTQIPTEFQRIPWSTSGYYLPERPFFTFDPKLHGGVYYVQEASSMFLEQALRQSADLSEPIRVLDLCAAPGGKSTLLQSIISRDSLLVSNDVIKSRSNILEENLTKWGGENVVVTNNDPKDFAKLEGFFDVIVVDAPCSGSGLFRRDPSAIEEWSEQNVALCSQRQQRILADVYPALKKDGVLIYSTCSFSESEDEEIADWVIDEFGMTNITLLVDIDWGIVQTTSKTHHASSYRFYPDKLKGEGFFISCFRKNEGTTQKFKQQKKTLLQRLSKDETAVVLPWLHDGAEVSLWKHADTVIAFPATHGDLLLTLSEKLYIRKAGIAVGKIAGKDLVPEHALALSTIINDKIVGISLNLQDALQYLRKEEVKTDMVHKGWALVLHEGVRLGWIKVLPNRTNNYYPKEWRILKSENN